MLLTLKASASAFFRRCAVEGSGKPGQALDVSGQCATEAFSEFAVVAFSLPTTSVPIRVWSPAAGESVTVSVGASGKDYTQPVQFVGVGNKDYDVWTVGQGVMMLNNALGQAHFQATGAPGGAWLAFAPESGLFTLSLPHEYCNGSLTLFATYSVARLLANVGGLNPLAASLLHPPKEFQYTCVGGEAQPQGGALLRQETPSLYAWTELARVDLNTSAGVVTLSDLAPLSAAPRRGLSREPYAFAGEPVWLQAAPAGKSVVAIASAAYVMATGERRPLRLGAADTFRVVFGTQ